MGTTSWRCCFLAQDGVWSKESAAGLARLRRVSLNALCNSTRPRPNLSLERALRKVEVVRSCFVLGSDILLCCKCYLLTPSVSKHLFPKLKFVQEVRHCRMFDPNRFQRLAMLLFTILKRSNAERLRQFMQLEC